MLSNEEKINSFVGNNHTYDSTFVVAREQGVTNTKYRVIQIIANAKLVIIQKMG